MLPLLNGFIEVATLIQKLWIIAVLKLKWNQRGEDDDGIFKGGSWGILNGCTKGDEVGEFTFTGEKGRQ